MFIYILLCWFYWCVAVLLAWTIEVCNVTGIVHLHRKYNVARWISPT